MDLLLNEFKRTHFLNEISSENFKFLNDHRFNWCISISYIIKNSPKNCTHNPSFEVDMQFFQLYERYYFVTNIFYMFKFY
jgi:hypothetical protein